MFGVKVGRCWNRRVQLRRGESVAHPSHIPSVEIGVFVILKSRVFQDFGKMKARSRPQRSDGAILGASLVPGSTRHGKHRFPEEPFAVPSECHTGIWLGLDRRDAISLKLGDDSGDVIAGAFEHDDEGTGADSGVGSMSHKVIGNAMSAQAEVRLWMLFPLGAEIQVATAVDRESWREGRVEARGTDNSVDLAELPIRGENPVFGDS